MCLHTSLKGDKTLHIWHLAFLFSLAAIADMMNTDLVDTAGYAASSLGIYVCCGSPLMHALPLILLVCFSFKNKSKDKEFTQSTHVSLVGSIVVQVSITCSCINSSIAAGAPLVPNFLKPGFKLHCVIKYDDTFISSLDSVINLGSIVCTDLPTLLPRV